MFLIRAYKSYSKSANQLAEAMGAILLNKKMKLFKAEKGDVVINWGSSSDFEEVKTGYDDLKIINNPYCVKVAVDKLSTFQTLVSKGLSDFIPKWTKSHTEAMSMSKDGAVCVRQTLKGHDGDGLIIHKGPASSLPEGKLYTAFVPAKAEYRVSVCRLPTDNPEVIDNYSAFAVQKKVRMEGKDSYNDDVKTTGGGYGLKLLSEGDIPSGIRPAAKRIVAALGLDFGGVDIIVPKNGGNPIVLEVNSAPELTPHLVSKYSKYLKDLVLYEKEKNKPEAEAG